MNSIDLAIWFGLALSVLLVYGQVDHFDFVSYDDPEYVTENPYIQNGLTVESLKGAWTTPAVGNWIPVTVMTHIVDGQLFGMQSGAHHLVNVLLHALAAILLFAALQLATGSRWPSAFVAAVFALHPLHVESVAWVSERKDVLSAVFAFLALYLYVRYIRQPSLSGYLLVAAAFGLGLMSKPMLVTLPLLLLLLDYWPLQRPWSPRIILEKLPLIALSAADSVVTYLVQGTAVQVIPLGLRLRTAVVSCFVYVAQMFWPAGLAVFYPYHSVAVWQVALAALFAIAVSALAIYWRREFPYLLVGWFWFLGTLIPVIGIVQAGAQAHADRYTYIPLIGLSIMLAWGGVEVLKRWPEKKNAVALAAIVSCVVCMALTSNQAAYWQNNGTLFAHALEVTQDNYIAQNGYANYLALNGRESEAIPHYEEFLRMVPDDAAVHNNVGILYSKMPNQLNPNQLNLAIRHFEAAVRKEPNFKEAQFNLGVALSHVPGRTEEAIAHLDAARRIQPSATVSQMIDRLRAGQPAQPVQ